MLDEPTTGLHFEDIRKLLGVLGRLVDAGNTVVVIEHNLDVIKTADWLVDMGPEGGSRGGTLVAEGTPEQIAATPESYTGEFLRPILEGREVPVGLVQEAFAARVAAPMTKAAVKRAAQAEKAAATKRLPGEVPTNGRAPAKKASPKAAPQKAAPKKVVASARKAS